MKKPWKDPLDRPAKHSTLETPGDFAKFAEKPRNPGTDGMFPELLLRNEKPASVH
jgi:hypothetical protein